MPLQDGVATTATDCTNHVKLFIVLGLSAGHCHNALLVPRQGFGFFHQILLVLLHLRALLIDDPLGAFRVLLDKPINLGLHAKRRVSNFGDQGLIFLQLGSLIRKNKLSDCSGDHVRV